VPRPDRARVTRVPPPPASAPQFDVGPLQPAVASMAPQNTVAVPPTDNARDMVTRGKHGFCQPKVPFGSDAAPLSPVLKTFRSALVDPNWRDAMTDEFSALLSNNTWDLVPRPPGANVVIGKWIFKHKFRSDGSLERYKACWVLRGFTQRPGVDFAETFNPVVKPATIRTVLTVALSLSIGQFISLTSRTPSSMVL
jgi:hypothetical protein